MIRVLLADDHPVLRSGLRRALEGSGMTVVAEAGDGLSALRAVVEHTPDVVLMDVSLPGMGGIEATRRIRASRPETAVVMLTMFADRPTMIEAQRAGASGYLVKDCSTDDIVATLASVAAGEGPVPLPEADAEDDHVLSRREVEVLQLLAEGAGTAEVAKRLYISVKTVKNHLSSIYEKVDARDRTQAVLAGQRLGLVRIPAPRPHHSA